MFFTEDTYEQALIALFQELGFRYKYGPDIEREYSNPLLDDVLQESLQRINPTLPASAIDDAIRKLQQIEGSSLYECNFKFTQMMQYGMSQLPEEYLNQYVESVIKDEKQRAQYRDQAVTRKIVAKIQETVTVEQKEISMEDFSALLK